MNTDRYDSLTEVEVEGLSYLYNFADGHAYHDINEHYVDIINNLQRYWQEGKEHSIPDMEKAFKNQFAELIDSSTLHSTNHFSVCPTASNSIDIVAAWLHKENKRTALIEPAFDNLYLLLKRRGVDISAFDELALKNEHQLAQIVSSGDIDALFLVNPNNPTGLEMTESEFIYLVEQCKAHNITILLDRTFRIYGKTNFDDYQILEQSGIDYVVIEDTGKTWPTQDLKISLMVYSEAISSTMRLLYEEIFLCSSNFALALLKQFIAVTAKFGVDATIKNEVRRRSETINDALSGTGLKVFDNDEKCQLPLCWIDISATGYDDVSFAARLKEHDIAVLPGRFFYWNSKSQHTQFIRVSLMKPDAEFYEGVGKLKEAVTRILEK
ncbi:hypothetical protein N473_05350 [Pseudoalteromonas luteoviolacea CPMOR-1]|uniref:Aminotransferase class I/classII large domain-containing protein n=1 Tax=Pseudoalteromonas luteoviolacea CPMOR-1 TaxID=1365248 RepID=A0A167HIA4_9GAMM|nr:pyridoxal phosphate-dependent aminotransferase [Pseudoalteromonas luteoviolacea]KZN58168.1 hypothetical protein N473_05350 [Pseudoalteromonas luteoviolacea CPMOR-1]